MRSSSRSSTRRTHQLARYFLEIDANYKQFKTASRLRAAAAQRLDAQRAYYEEGRITIDRFLDAVSQYAQAVATEAEYKTLYNISIIVFEEAKGTLLAYNNIAVAEGPQPRKAYVQAKDIQNAHRKLPIPHDGPIYNPPVSGPVNPDPVPANPPPGVQPGNVPALPAPGGTLGPEPTPSAPYRPAGEPPILSQKPAQGVPGGAAAPVAARPRLDGSALPAAGTSAPAAAGPPPSALPANLVPAAPAATGAPPARAGAGRGATARPEAGDELPVLPTEIDLPPLPPK